MIHLLRLYLLFLTGLLAAQCALHGGIEVIVQLETSSKAYVRDGEASPPSIGLFTIRIEDTWMQIDEGESVLIMDRAGDRLISHASADKTFESTSFFALFEMRADAYAKVLTLDAYGYQPGKYGTASPEVLADHLFSITNPESDQQPELEDSPEKRRWMSGAVVLAWWSKKGRDLSPTQMDNFAFWLRQISGGHPMIIADLVGGGVLPDRCEIVLNNGRSIKNVGVEVIGLREVPELDLESRMDGFSLQSEHSDGDALVALLDWVCGGTVFAESPVSVAQAHTAAVKTAFEAGDPVRGILQLIRMQMVTGVPPGVQLERYDAEIKASRTAANLLRNLNMTRPEAAEAAIQTFEVLSEAFDDQAPVLDVLMAENYVHLGQFGRAEELYRNAILSDPGLALAYKGLGDLYRSMGRYSLAWMCLDAFESVAPDHPGMERVREMKQIMAEDFPNFF